MMVFYFCKGIPDDEWYISPGKKGQSVEYFPHFEKQHHLTKAWFDYYADVFYYKLFSAWDTLGHLLNIMYGLEVDKPSFNRVLKKLKAIRPDLYTELKNLEDSPEFEQARKTRHDITHNLLPGHVGPGVQRVSKNDITFGVGSYTPSAKIKENAIKFLNLFGAALDAIKKQNAKDDPVRVA